MKILSFILSLGLFNICFSQEITVKLDNAMKLLQQDKQFEHSILSLYVLDSKTGKVVYAKNEQTGLAPASCQKIVTSASAFELLGAGYTYQTEFGYSGEVKDSILSGNLYIIGNGDPTLGSWRWKQTSEDFIMQKIKDGLKKLHIQIAKSFVIDNTKWGSQTLPGGWPWEDIGQYYGAGSSSFNWHENQYDIVLKPGNKIGDKVEVLSANPYNIANTINELTTAAKGTGDQVYVYCAPYSIISFLRGTAALGSDTLTVAASTMDGVQLFEGLLLDYYRSKSSLPRFRSSLTKYLQRDDFDKGIEKNICTFTSPTLDSINYWFLKKSINLYGEAFVKTIAYQQTKVGSTDSGVNVIRDFWSSHGIEKSVLKIIDGSGLSPANRLTTNALVTVLQYARQRAWFSSFYNALPEMNGIKMKDGYIGGVRSYTGYVKSATGAEYSFAFIVNNFDGAPGTAREKMWKVLDLLK